MISRLQIGQFVAPLGLRFVAASWEPEPLPSLMPPLPGLGATAVDTVSPGSGAPVSASVTAPAIEPPGGGPEAVCAIAAVAVNTRVVRLSRDIRLSDVRRPA